MPRIYTLNDVGNSDGSKLGSPPSNRYPPSRLELEEQLKKDREMFIRSAKQLIAKYHALDKEKKHIQNDLVRSHEENESIQNDLDHSHEENERIQNYMNQIIPLTVQLNDLSNKLGSKITCERKSHAEHNAKRLKEIGSLKSEINLKDSEITFLEARINELEARLLTSSKSEKLCENFTYDPSCSSIEQRGNSSLEIRVEELKNELEKVTQNSSFKDGLIFCLRSRVSDLERQAERDELEQIPLPKALKAKSHPSSNDSKTGDDAVEEVSGFFAEDAQSRTPSFSSHRLELEPITAGHKVTQALVNEKSDSFFQQYFVFFIVIILLIIYFLWRIFSHLYSFNSPLNKEKNLPNYKIPLWIWMRPQSTNHPEFNHFANPLPERLWLKACPI
ncbi:hypothetical protein C1645_789490 [Glomus cerebriforme]|uniref:Uncharacterized protein n=1 Tax=Glomus cerebriforme TaxID=658196 RepID=A0A397SAE3_9GLOM|nr:hypothetical protein C1645_789490 [Glomus cerebriforme]